MLYESRIDGLSAITSKFAGKRVLVVGDLMLDEYIWGQVSRVSPEAPVLVVDAERYSEIPGGAANVVNNLCVLGAKSSVAGVIGDDDPGRKLTSALQDEGADTTAILSITDRPTTRKVRVVAHSQQVVRVDHEKRTNLTTSEVSELLLRIEDRIASIDAIILSDYQKGVLCEPVLQGCIRLAKGFNKPIAGNLKPLAIRSHCELTLITLNLLEASQAIGTESLSTEHQIEDAGQILLERTGAEHILITRGANGLTLISKSANGRAEHVPPHTVAVYDTTGAGDTVISTMTLALASGAEAIDAVLLANYAAAEVVKKVGVATVSVSEINAAVAKDL